LPTRPNSAIFGSIFYKRLFIAQELETKKEITYFLSKIYMAALWGYIKNVLPELVFNIIEIICQD
jgi:hypothetical protein